MIWIPFIYFDCLIDLTRASRTILDRSGESGHSCLISDLKEKVSSFSPLCIMLAVSRNKFLLSVNYSVCGILLQQPECAEMVILVVSI